MTAGEAPHGSLVTDKREAGLGRRHGLLLQQRGRDHGAGQLAASWLKVSPKTRVWIIYRTVLACLSHVCYTSRGGYSCVAVNDVLKS